MSYCAVFPGQGSQKQGMGSDFFLHDEYAKEILDKASKRIDVDLRDIIENNSELLEKTEYTQPAILLVSVLCYESFRRAGAGAPSLAIGHSLGEYSALVSAGALDIVDAVWLVNHRGKLMQECSKEQESAMMVVLGLEDAVLEKYIDSQRANGKKVWCANYNCDGQMVLAGLKKDLESETEAIKSLGAKRAMLLNMSVSSHSPLLESMGEEFGKALESTLKDSFAFPIVSNVTAKPYATKNEAVDLLKKQLVSPVRYKQSVSNVDSSIDCYVEFGNGAVLKGLNKKISEKETLSVSDIAMAKECAVKVG